MKTIKLEQGSTEWLAFRTNGVGASEIASIAGVKGAFSKRHDVMMEKLGAKKEISDFQKKLFADGHEWEALVRENLNAGGAVNYQPVVVVSDENPRLFASLDGYDKDLGLVLEVKSVTTEERFKEYCERVPEHYEAQVQWQLFVTGCKGATIAFVHAGQVVTRYIVSNQDVQNRLHACAIEFLQELDAIKNGKAPAPVQTLTTHEMSRLAQLKKIQSEMKIQLDMIDEEMKQLSEKIINEMKANRVESDEITVQVVERQGSINYGKIPEVQRLSESYLNSFRGKGSKSIQVKMKGTN